MYPRGASQVQCSMCGTVNCALAVSVFPRYPRFIAMSHMRKAVSSRLYSAWLTSMQHDLQKLKSNKFMICSHICAETCSAIGTSKGTGQLVHMQWLLPCASREQLPVPADFSNVGMPVLKQKQIGHLMCTPHRAVVCAQANQIGHLVCAFCHMTLMYAHGAASVKCAVCNHVTPVTASSLTHAPAPLRYAQCQMPAAPVPPSCCAMTPEACNFQTSENKGCNVGTAAAHSS
jgi:LSD1 subclass zinc finger protein